MQPESVESFHARVLAATDDERRLPVAVEEMPGWDIFPYEIETLRIKPLQPLADAEPARRGEDPADCWCAGASPVPDGTIWSNERWLLVSERAGLRLPMMAWLQPRAHHDLADLPPGLAAEFGGLITAVAAAVEALPSVGRVQLGRWGDGGAHLHLAFFGRPLRMLQLRGSPLIDWEENLPLVPPEVAAANLRFVADHLVSAVGGESRIP